MIKCMQLGCLFVNKRLRLRCVFDILNKFNLYIDGTYMVTDHPIINIPSDDIILDKTNPNKVYIYIFTYQHLPKGGCCKQT